MQRYVNIVHSIYLRNMFRQKLPLSGKISPLTLDTHFE